MKNIENVDNILLYSNYKLDTCEYLGHFSNELWLNMSTKIR